MKRFFKYSLVREIYKFRVFLCLSVIVCTIVFGVIGLYNSRKPYSEQELRVISIYEETLKEYDALIEDLEASIAVTEKLITDLEDYCNNSIYMQLNSQNIQVAALDYTIETEDSLSGILGAITSFINEGSLKEGLEQELKDITHPYLAEIISCSTRENIVHVSVIHYDALEAERIISAIDKLILEEVSAIAEIQGDFKIQLLNKANYAKAENAVLNYQSTNYANLKNYQTNLSDIKKRIIDQKNSKSEYEKSKRPDNYEVISVKRTVVGYALFGSIFGVVVPVSIYVLYSILAERLRNKNDLQARGITVLGEYSKYFDYIPSLSRTCYDIQLLLKKNGKEKVFFNILNEQKDMECILKYMNELKKEGIEVVSGNAFGNNVDDLEVMVEVGNSVIVARRGVTSYKQIDEQIRLCQTCDVVIWGGILVD